MEKSDFKALKEQLLSRRRNGFDRLDGAERDTLESYCAGYKAFLDAGKTERLCAAEAIRLAEQAGYRPYVRGMAVKAGDKVYLSNRGKSVLLAHIGEKSLAEGARIAAAHIDSPRLDLKPNPLYEDGELAYFKTLPGEGSSHAPPYPFGASLGLILGICGGRKKKQEKALTPERRQGGHNCPQCGQLQGFEMAFFCL